MIRDKKSTEDESEAITVIDDTSKSSIGTHLTPTKRLWKNNKRETIGGTSVFLALKSVKRVPLPPALCTNVILHVY